MSSLNRHFSSIWVVVVAVVAQPGERLEPLALVAKDLETRHLVEIGVPELRGVKSPPYPTGPQCLLITIDANELVGCHLALEWRVPERIVDLSVEFRNATNGQRLPCGAGLVGALLWFGLPAAGAVDRGPSPAAAGRRIDAVVRLFEAMRSTLDLGRALLRGRYMAAVAWMEAIGVPVDQLRVERLGAEWPEIRRRIVELIDQQFGVYKNGRLQPEALESWLVRRGINWPRTPDGRFDLGDGIFRYMARLYPELRPLKELRTTVSGFDPNALAIGRDGRNRTPLRPFASRTGRNQPSSKALVLGSAAWLRHLVCPAPGMGLALVDWSQQEFGIAAALSRDSAMIAAYASGDPYLAFAIRAGAAPAGATCATHGDERERFKACALGVQYGMGPATLARQTGRSEGRAQELLEWHRKAFPAFWNWSDSVETQGLLGRQLPTVFGWRISVSADANPRFLRNYPMQANGAEMLRLACCLATEAGIRVCMPMHDALLIEARLDDLDETVRATKSFMARASAIVLDGFELRTKAKLVCHPERYSDPRGSAIWNAVEMVLSDA